MSYNEESGQGSGLQYKYSIGGNTEPHKIFSSLSSSIVNADSLYQSCQSWKDKMEAKNNKQISRSVQYGSTQYNAQCHIVKTMVCDIV